MVQAGSPAPSGARATDTARQGSDRPSSPRRSARPADGSAATRPAAKYPAIAPHSSQCCPFGRTSSPWATAEPSAVASATRKPVITACSSIASLGASVPSRSRGMPLVPYSRLSVQTAASRANAPRPVAASGRSQCSRSEAASMIWMTPSPSTMITYSPSRSPMCAVSIRDSLSRGGSGAGEWAGPGGGRPSRRRAARSPALRRVRSRVETSRVTTSSAMPSAQSQYRSGVSTKSETSQGTAPAPNWASGQSTTMLPRRQTRPACHRSAT